MNPSGLTLSIAIITLNEERNLGRCLSSFRFSPHLFQEIQVIVVDAESRDNTVALARERGAQVFIRPWQGYADQRNWALARCTGDWILVMDADEELTPDLIAEIETEIPRASLDVDGYNLARRTFFCGKWIRHCGWYPGYQLRLFRRGAGRYPNVHLHEGVVIGGRALHLTAPMNHYSYDSIRHYVEKANRYTDLEILDIPPLGSRNPGYHLIVAPFRKFLSGISVLTLRFQLLYRPYDLSVQVFRRCWSTGFPAAPGGAGFASGGQATPGDTLFPN